MQAVSASLLGLPAAPAPDASGAAQSAAVAVEGRNADQGADRAAVQPAQLRQLGRQRQ